MDKKAVLQFNLKEIKLNLRLEYEGKVLKGDVLVTDLHLQSVVIKGNDLLETYSILRVLKLHK